jgi:hypothetical protein
VAIATGAVLLVVGWVKVSGTPYAAEQIPVLVSCGLGGVFLLGLGTMLWHSADLRDQWRKLDRLEERFDAVVATSGVNAHSENGVQPAAASRSGR